MEKTGIGIIGCGNISATYLKNCAKFDWLKICAVADAVPERAAAKAAELGVPAVGVQELLTDPEIRIVVNLTVPAAHYQVAMAAVRAGKSVWNEKPLCIERAEAGTLLKEAARKKVLVGCAPDTFLGAAHQTCRRLIDEGAIGAPVAAAAFMMSHGPEAWHPNPEIFYKKGAGPLFDMGPYYLTALVNLLGPVRRVTASARASFRERIAGAPGRKGDRIPVEVETHVAGVLDFRSGPVATLITSFDVWASQLPRIEVYGSEGTLVVPDPNHPGGTPLIRKAADQGWSEVPLTFPLAETARAIGVADMARALSRGRPHRAGGEMAYHVLECMHGLLDASRSGRHQEIRSACGRPEALAAGGLLD